MYLFPIKLKGCRIMYKMKGIRSILGSILQVSVEGERVEVCENGTSNTLNRAKSNKKRVNSPFVERI